MGFKVLNPTDPLLQAGADPEFRSGGGGGGDKMIGIGLGGARLLSARGYGGNAVSSLGSGAEPQPLCNFRNFKVTKHSI